MSFVLGAIVFFVGLMTGIVIYQVVLDNLRKAKEG